ncbi:PAS domain-containing protein [Thalassolituus sp. LLYu03]|uniref:PAS domain-containing protein n=1 Tax=Thalassolituus sp. LLYu03 TaxID=3421656 RepID=UPI003D281517
MWPLTPRSDNDNDSELNRAYKDALWANNAIIEFSPDGTITDVNDLFLSMVGYRRDEVEGRHHRMMCPPDYAASDEYREFWLSLAAGRFHSGLFLRRDCAGRDLWLRATYYPVELNGEMIRVLKVAQNVTAEVEERHRQKSILQALDRSQAIIEFAPDGIVTYANSNYLTALGYGLEEVVGKHHRSFCQPDFYQDNPCFWKELASGDFKRGTFERRHKDGHSIWLEASYNPIFDNEGRVEKIIKFAHVAEPRSEAAVGPISLSAS